jgi:hypothetical protein
MAAKALLMETSSRAPSLRRSTRPVAEVLEYFPSNHRALSPRVSCDDHSLHAPERLLDLVDLELVRLTGAAAAVGEGDALENDGESLEAPRLPLLLDVTRLLCCERCLLPDTQIVVGDLKKRCSCRIAEGFSKKNSVRVVGCSLMLLECATSR